MGSVRKRNDKNQLFIDFYYLGKRCREASLLEDSAKNRKKLEGLLSEIESKIETGVFRYSDYFPKSRSLKKILELEQETGKTLNLNLPTTASISNATQLNSATSGDRSSGFCFARVHEQPATFAESCDAFIELNKPLWKVSNLKTKQQIVDSVLKPKFGQKRVDQITRQEILEFRSHLAKDPSAMTGKPLSPSRVNHVMTCLKQVLDEAADQHQFTTPYYNIKRLKEPKTDVNPFTPNEINLILENCRSDYRDLFTVRFFTGMRSAELFGLKWEYVDFDRRVIMIRITIVDGREETPKTEGSIRDIRMTPQVYDALVSQYQVTGHLGGFVFCNALGSFMCNKNFTNRIWYPLLSVLGIKKRKPYQSRHTYATMMLAAGEAPEFIANQMGHGSTEMLFTVYSRYVPNLTRNDGSAFEQMLTERLGGGAHQVSTPASSQIALPVPPKVVQPTVSQAYPQSLPPTPQSTQPHQLIPPLPPEEAKPIKPKRPKVPKPVTNPNRPADLSGQSKHSLQQQAVWAEMHRNMTGGGKS